MAKGTGGGERVNEMTIQRLRAALEAKFQPLSKEHRKRLRVQLRATGLTDRDIAEFLPELLQ